MVENVIAPNKQVAIRSKTATPKIFAPFFTYPKYTSLDTFPIFDVSSTCFCPLSPILVYELGFFSEIMLLIVNV